MDKKTVEYRVRESVVRSYQLEVPAHATPDEVLTYIAEQELLIDNPRPLNERQLDSDEQVLDILPGMETAVRVIELDPDYTGWRLTPAQVFERLEECYGHGSGQAELAHVGDLINCIRYNEEQEHGVLTDESLRQLVSSLAELSRAVASAQGMLGDLMEWGVTS